jgi:hypothetical protein
MTLAEWVNEMLEGFTQIWRQLIPDRDIDFDLLWEHT